MNWNSLLLRSVIGFITLFFLAYLIPGLSALTLTHLIIVSLLLAFLSTVGENIIIADTHAKKSIFLLVVSAVTVYFYALVIVREGVPVVSVVLTAAFITLLDHVFALQNESSVIPEEGVNEEGNGPYQE